MLKQDPRNGDRPHRHRKRLSEVDTIDALDTIGGNYHHGGPYDATLTSRNLNSKYSPVAAVKDSNRDALRATPRENVLDSLNFHVPLQGTASIPPGDVDMSGNIMDYTEGADLMREPDAAGGPYKRWDGIQYHPDDLKGKGDPSFTIERDLKKHRHQASESGIELQPNVNRSLGRVRSSSASKAQQDTADSSGLRRSNSTGKRLSDGLRRRFGSLKKKTGA